MSLSFLAILIIFYKEINPVVLNIYKYKIYQMSSHSIISSKPSKYTNTGIDTETIFKYINIIVTLILLFCIKGFLSFRELCQQKSYYVINVDSIVWILVGFLAIFILKYSWFYFGREWIESIVHSKYEGQERVYKTRATLKLSFDSIFYTFVTIFAYTFFRHQYWFPAMAGGCGSCLQIYKQYPNWPLNSRRKLEIYFMIQLGIHSFSLFQMIFLKRKTERKYYEYVLHHSVAVSLILFSTLSNQIVAGAMILIIHDASDIFMAFFRFYIQTKFNNNIVAGLSYILTAVCWIWMRIIVYPFCLLAQVYANKPTSQDMWSMIQFQYGYLLTMALVLYGMHLFWTYLILKVGIRTVTKNAVLQNIHDKKMKQ